MPDYRMTDRKVISRTKRLSNQRHELACLLTTNTRLRTALQEIKDIGTDRIWEIADKALDKYNH